MRWTRERTKTIKKIFLQKNFEIKMMNLLNLSLYGLCKKKVFKSTTLLPSQKEQLTLM
jgi:hypothetical protein